MEPRELLVYFLRERLGLTGTNVGCDTSSCGTCTIHLDGESVKSCTVLAVQADGRAVTTIEGLATNGTMHPMQQAFQDNHALQCGFCTPGMIMAAVSLLRTTRTRPRTRSATASRATSAAAPATTTSSRPCRPWRARRGRHGNHRTAGQVRRGPGPAQGGPRAHHGPGALHGRHHRARDALDVHGAQPVRARQDQRASTCPRPRPRPAWWPPTARPTWARTSRPRWSWPGRSPTTSRPRPTSRWPPTRPGAWATPSPWSSPRRACRPRTPPSWSRSTGSRSPAVTDIEAAMADGAPLVHDDLGTNVSCTWGFATDSPAPRRNPAGPYFDDPSLVKIKERYRIERLIPNAMEPRSVVADCNIPLGEFTLYSTTQIPHVARTAFAITCGIPEAKLRVIAPDVGGGFGSKLEVYPEEALALAPGPQGGPADQVDRGALGGLPGHAARPRPDPGDGAGGHAGRHPEGRALPGAGLDGRLLRAGLGRHPDARRLALRRRVRPRGVRLRVHERLHQQHADRRLPRRRAARGHLRHRARHGRAGPRAEDGPGGAPQEELHQDGELPQLHHRQRPDRRLGRLQRHVRHAAGEARLQEVPRRAGRAAAGRRDQDDRRRLLDLARDVRAGPLAGAARAQVHRRRLGRGDDRVHAHRHGARAHRRVAPRAGARDHVLADRGRPARRGRQRRRGHARRHPGDPARHGHLRQPQPGRGRHRHAPRRREDHRQGADAGRLPARVRRGGPGVRGRQLHGQGHGQVGEHQGPGLRRLDGPRPARGLRAGAGGDPPLRPAQLLLARTARTPAWSRWTRRRATWTSSATSPSTTAA